MPKTQRLDFDAINAAALPALFDLCCDWLPGGTKEGNEYKAGDINGGKGRSLSVNLHTGVWKDFAGDDHGSDPISLLAAVRGVKQGDAAKELADKLGVAANDNAPRQRKQREPEKPKPVPIIPVPAQATPATFDHFKFGVPSHVYPYFNGDGAVLLYICRFDLPDGSKEVCPRSWCREHDGTERWGWYGYRDDQLRPLFGLEELAKRPGVPVLVVEGEKTCLAARTLFPDLVVVAWLGGTSVGKKARIDLSALRGRRVVLWPDADLQAYKGKHPQAGQVMPRSEQPGLLAMHAIAEKLHGVAEAARLVRYPDGVKGGWDLADAKEEGWDTARALEYLRANLYQLDNGIVAQHEEQPPQDDGPPPDPADDPGPEQMEPEGDAPPPGAPAPRAPDDEHMPFSPLGHDRGTFCYLVKATGQIVRLTAGAHTSNGLLQLAPLQYWELEFPARKEGCNWSMAVNFCMRRCEFRGIFDPGRVRGRGCWWDDGKMVLHLGDCLIVDGQRIKPTAFKSRNVYEAAAAMAGPADVPLTAAEAREIVEISKRFAWDMPASAALLAGWIALAPVCGALTWRPHVWLSGGTGSGKSTILTDFVARLQAGTEVRVQGSSTEAGIRQTLRADARPVLIDESEQNNEREQNRMQAILALIRQSSSEGGAQTLRGTASGDALTFHVRSMFCLASIQVGIQQQSDHTRIAVLNLRASSQLKADEQIERQKMWRETERILADLRDRDDYARRLMARTVSLIGTIRKNVKVFTRAAAERFSSQRLGDQYGTLLAGCFSLYSDNEATHEDALKLIDRFEWSSYTEAATEDESDSALSSIMQAMVRFEGTARSETATLGELVVYATGRLRAEAIPQEIAEEVLARYGLRVKGDALLVANTSDQLARVLRDRPWGTDWRSYLRRVRGAIAVGPTQFAPGHLSRCTSVPLSRVVGAA